MEVLKIKEQREFEQELHSLYPFLEEEEVKNIIQDMIIYWDFIIKNIDKMS